MTADEMFEKLGYEKSTLNNITSYEIKHKKVSYRIDFVLEYNCIELEPKDTYFVRLTPKEIQAINKKCEELGWHD